MTIRITLLVLVTGLFAMIWTHDQPAAKPNRGRQALAKPTEIPVPEDSNIAASLPDDGSTSAPRWISGKLAAARQSWESDWRPALHCEIDTVLEESSRYIASAGQDWARNQFAASAREVRQWVTVNIARPQIAEVAAKPVAYSNLPLPAGIVPGEYRAVSATGTVRHLTLTWGDLPRDSEFVTQDVYQSSSESGRWFFVRVQSNPQETVPVIADRIALDEPAHAKP